MFFRRVGIRLHSFYILLRKAYIEVEIVRESGFINRGEGVVCFVAPAPGD